jgi:uncharacterized membrane protein YccC
MSNELQLLLGIQHIAAIFIFIWAAFCVLSPLVRTGVVGCVLFGFLMLVSFGVTVSPPGSMAWLRLNVIMDCFIAACGLRHLWMKCLWPSIRFRYLRLQGKDPIPQRRESDQAV